MSIPLFENARLRNCADMFVVAHQVDLKISRDDFLEKIVLSLLGPEDVAMRPHYPLNGHPHRLPLQARLKLVQMIINAMPPTA